MTRQHVPQTDRASQAARPAHYHAFVHVNSYIFAIT
jgi:hypothetical protein